ncbi:MAG TPA: zf-HC2 domain-containing protein [Thermoanaerobaculia bacterium]|nr:zf-HC2 domain-containing protein [Thermoanaerobaculia bacterium]
MRITCKQLIDSIADYLDGALDAASTLHFEHHLELCTSCRAYLATYRMTIRLAREMCSF